MLASRHEFDPRRDPAMNFDTLGSASIVFCPFLRGVNSTHPVNCLGHSSGLLAAVFVLPLNVPNVFALIPQFTTLRSNKERDSGIMGGGAACRGGETGGAHADDVEG